MSEVQEVEYRGPVVERERLVVRLMHLAYMVHENTDYCVFINFSGHIDRIEISIRESMKNWQTKVLEAEIQNKFNEIYSETKDAHLAALRAKVAVLEQILKDGEVDYYQDGVEYEEWLEREYTF